MARIIYCRERANPQGYGKNRYGTRQLVSLKERDWVWVPYAGGHVWETDEEAAQVLSRIPININRSHTVALKVGI